ncbi:LysR substrate-binding domain-containing protein [Parasalinivibrio latis]|uniref:LysR substrate-binding domain-containing protein n=1 Tax=Parasalinivibrio latis TaxID=2952610 RepID=UPI0030E43E26
MQNLDLDQLRTLVAIHDCGNFNAAAETVYRTQSAVSMQMKKLEEKLDVALFEKQGRSYTFTAQGMQLVSYARQMLALNDEVVAAFSSPEIGGEVKIGVCDDYVEQATMSYLSAFTRSYPSVQLSIFSNNSRRLATMLQRGEIDLALVNVHEELWHAEVLHHESLAWVKARDTEFPSTKPIPLAIERNCRWGRLAVERLENAGIPFRVVVHSADFQGLQAAVKAGMAVALVAKSSVSEPLEVMDLLASRIAPHIVAVGLMVKSGATSPAVLALASQIRQWYQHLDMSVA